MAHHPRRGWLFVGAPGWPCRFAPRCFVGLREAVGPTETSRELAVMVAFPAKSGGSRVRSILEHETITEAGGCDGLLRKQIGIG